MSLNDDDIYNLLKVRRTVLKMLLDRGYFVEEDEFKMAKQELIEKFGVNMSREDLFMEKTASNDSSNKIYVFFPNDVKVSTTQVRNYISRMKADGISRAILVCRLSPSPYAKRCVDEVSMRFRLEIFEEADLIVNITEHVLVPRHEPLTDEAKKKLLADYSVKETQLPRILVTDPVARYYGLRRGQIVKIYRKSETAGEYITYRYVT